MGINSTPQLTRFVCQKGVLRDQPFSLIDVGASGGIQDHWREFGDSLQAIGFDPLHNEVERLNAAEHNPRVRYVASRVGYRDMTSLSPQEVFSTDPHLRTSSVRAWELLNCDYVKTYYDQAHLGTAATDLIELDGFFGHNPGGVDVIKVDTDGDDLAVLFGGRKLLAGAGPVALAVETPLAGPLLPFGNVFSNIDAYLQRLGYSLFAIEPRFHSRAALPKPFRWSQPADTHSGQARWADTIFCRDVCIPGYEAQFKVTLTAHKLLKLCCTFELFSLEDCAAEILVKFRDRIQPLIDVEHCLDLLTPPLPDGRTVSYRSYIDFFEKNVTAFYSGTGKPAEECHFHQGQIARLETENRRLLATLQHAVPELKARLDDAELERESLRHSIEDSLALKLARSIPWLLRPLRSLLMKRRHSPS